MIVSEFKRRLPGKFLKGVSERGLVIEAGLESNFQQGWIILVANKFFSFFYSMTIDIVKEVSLQMLIN